MESLYTTYRPQTFEDVAGQRAIVGALERAVVNQTVGHAYLFCGPRGTGKTTLARILAKALECDEGPGVLPDGTCEQCQAIALGIHPDVQELDAASRNGVNDIRDEVISKVNFAPVRGRYKVYIIDEVHMLSTAAFNALLKTLEEPPEHVVFIFCTTDPQKVLPTVLSRVQRFNFSPLSDEDIRRRLEVICEREGFSVSPEAMTLIVRHAHGGMRDAISTLEQLAVFGDGRVDEAMARDLLGKSDGDTLARFVAALAARDAGTLFSLVGGIVSEGRDLQQFNAELMGRVRDLYVVSVAGAIPGVVTATEEELAELQREAPLFGGPDRLSRILGELDRVAYSLRTAPDPRLVFEVALTKLARPECDLTLESLAERVARLEGSLPAVPRSPMAPVTPGQGMPPAQAPAPVQAPAPEPRQAPAAAPRTAQPAASAPAPTPQPAQAPASAPQPQPAQAPASAPQPQPVQAPASASASQPVQASDPVQQPQPVHASAPDPQPVRTSAPERQPTPVPAPRQQPTAASAPASQTSPTSTDDPDDGRWKQVVASLPGYHAGFLQDSLVLGDDGSTLRIGIQGESHFTLGMLNRPDVKSAIEQAASRVYGPRKVSFEEAGSAPKGSSVPTGQGAGQAAMAAPRPVTPPPSAPFDAGSQRRPEPQLRQSVPPRPAPQAQPMAEPRPAVGYVDIPPTSAYDDVPPWEDLPATPSQPVPRPVAQAPRASAPIPVPNLAPAPMPKDAPQASIPVEDLDPKFTPIVDALSDAFGSIEVIGVEPPAQAGPAAGEGA